MIEIFDLGIRSMAAGILFVGMLASIRENPLPRKLIAVASASLINIALFFVTSIMFKEQAQTFKGWQAAYYVVLALQPVLTVWMLLELLDDRFRLKLWHFGILVFSITVYGLDYYGLPGPNRLIMHIACWGYLGYFAVRNYRHKINEVSHQLRVWFAGALSIVAIIIVIQNSTYAAFAPPAAYALGQAIVIFVLVASFGFFTLKIREQSLLLRTENSASIDIASMGFSPADISLLRKLTASMEGGSWKEEGLTIGRLAENLQAPEHRLRKIINTGLGHRNFAEFLNSYRLEEAQKLLSDPKRAETPIVSIASELGYASLGPFNRAFRDVVGTTPSEYRKFQLSNPDER